MNTILIIYAMAILLAIAIFLIYYFKTAKNYKSTEALSKEVSNNGAPISGGCKYFKIVNK